MTFSLGSTPRSLVKYNDQSISAITEVGSGSGVTDDMVLIKEQTASSSATISFVDGTSDVVLDSTYPIYVFKWFNIHPEEDGRSICFQANAAGGSGYNETITSTIFRAFHLEGDTTADLAYNDDRDQAQGTAVQPISFPTGNANDEATSGEILIFNPSSTTFVKHFLARSSDVEDNSGALNTFAAGYINTTSAVDEFQFSMNSGNIDAGTIKLYGIKDS